MRLLYYIMDRVETAESIAKTLQQLGISEEGYRITQRDGVPIRTDKAHPSFPQGDLMASHSDKGSMIGVMCGLLFVVWIAVIQPMGLTMSLVAFLGLSLLFAGLGAWIGRLVSISADADKRSPLHELMQRHSCRMVIGVDNPDNAREVRLFIRSRHPEAVFEAEDVVALRTPLAHTKLRVRPS
jgi:hypothetical protein